jgi:hypothetical protein
MQIGPKAAAIKSKFVRLIFEDVPMLHSKLWVLDAPADIANDFTFLRDLALLGNQRGQRQKLQFKRHFGVTGDGAFKMFEAPSS